ncbi:U-box domain-containing protein 33 [Phtheirospermum japonicum]|uniref:RING-type E3 ubiquitin transferase n=1 Tax=Phtheirospermum japonicum TaxID=374723 RepID=A0A830C041_9LAMI|nr:U-box domain-containing protein 33 [Phtheirospermum japonicum]
MAMVEIHQPIRRIKYPEIDLSNFSSRSSESMGAEMAIEKKSELKTTPSPEDMMCVALGKDAKESESVLRWALHKSRGMRICILHVHQPAQKITTMGGKVSISLMEEHLLKAHHEIERQEMQKILDKYIRICDQAGVRAEKLCIEMDSIEKGIVQLISEHGIKWLVMGAAANKSYSRNMREPKSKKAIHVRNEAPNFCHIWFICKGNLILTRESKVGGLNTETESPPFRACPIAETAHFLKSRSTEDGVNGQITFRNSSMNYRRAKSEIHGMQLLAPNPEGNSDCDSLSKRSPSVGSHFSTRSSGETEDSALIPYRITERNEMGSELPMFQQNGEDHRRSSVASDAIEQNVSDELYDRLKKFVAEAESSQKEVCEESVRRQKAEKDVIDAIRKAKASEKMHADELKRRREFEEALARGDEEVEKMKTQLGEIMQEHKAAQEQKLSLESQIADSDKTAEDLEQKMFSAVELLKKYKQERDGLQVQRDNALRVAEEMREKQAEEASCSSVSQFFSDFTFFEIEEATSNFSEALKIGEGGYGSIYRGSLRHTEVAIKMLHPNSLQGPFEFQQEVNILSMLRHPNIVTLIGACPEAWALIYEYLPNGSLEDCLNCKDNTPPLSWKTRLRIAAELCSALVFLHSCLPQGIVHGDLKPANILLDANFVCKLGNFRMCRELRLDEFSKNDMALFHKTSPKGTFVYMDPDFLASGELTSKSDVYSFGLILLRLLTGRPALGIAREVQYALDKGDLKDLLDPTAGDWPFVQAKQLAHLALGCAAMDGRARPDLASEVWRVLENMKVSCGVSYLRFGCEERNETPAYFICPIFQEIMQDPVAAADGFTYESEALKGWLESQDTSPMTNLKLPHRDFVPNHALRSAIQEWLQKS